MLASGCNRGEIKPTDTSSVVSGEAPSQPKTFLPVVVGQSPGEAAEAGVPEDPAVLQERLKNEWRPVVHGSAYVFAACEMMFDTYLSFQIAEIDLAGAQAQLAVESELVNLAQQGIAAWSAPGPEALAYWAQVEAGIGTLNDLLSRQDASTIGSAEISNGLLDTCLTLFDTQDAIANAASSAGMSEDSLSELESENTAVIEDFSNRIGRGN